MKFSYSTAQGGAVLLRVDGVLLLLRVDGVLVHHVAQVALAGGQQVVGARHEPGVLDRHVSDV